MNMQDRPFIAHFLLALPKKKTIHRPNRAWAAAVIFLRRHTHNSGLPEDSGDPRTRINLDVRRNAGAITPAALEERRAGRGALLICRQLHRNESRWRGQVYRRPRAISRGPTPFVGREGGAPAGRVARLVRSDGLMPVGERRDSGVAFEGRLEGKFQRIWASLIPTLWLVRLLRAINCGDNWRIGSVFSEESTLAWCVQVIFDVSSTYPLYQFIQYMLSQHLCKAFWTKLQSIPNSRKLIIYLCMYLLLWIHCIHDVDVKLTITCIFGQTRH